MQFFHQFPMVRVLIPFVSGILITLCWQPDSLMLFLVPAVVLFLAMALLNRQPGKVFQNLFGFSISLSLLLLGILISMQKQENRYADHFIHFDSDLLFIRISEPLTEKKKSWKTVGEVKAVMQDQKLVPTSGKILMYFQKDSNQRLPSFEETLMVYAKPAEIQSNANPGSFNYKVYLVRKGIYRQVFIRNGEWKSLKGSPHHSVKYYAIRLRESLLQLLKQNGLTGKEYGVAAALILGQDDFLDQETRQEFSSAGVVHILGISGLHVGIIYMTLNVLLGFLHRCRYGRTLKLLAVLALIWFYALLTGLSPAALRASTMFTFVSLGTLNRRNVHIINSLAASAFFLLLIDPYLLTNIGFQFSYVAVIGIVILQEPVSSLFSSRFRLLQEAWNLTVMSLSAQLFTFPITLYYFHQFPLYFLPANLLVIPLSNLVIYSGMAVLGSSMFPALSYLLGSGTFWLIRALNSIAAFVETLPYAVIKPLNIDMAALVLFYLLITSGCIGFLLHRKRWIIIGLVTGLSLSLHMSIRSIQTEQQHRLIVFSAPGHSVCSILKGRQSLILTDSTYGASPESSVNYLMNSLNYLGISQVEHLRTTSVKVQQCRNFAGLRKVPGGFILASGGKRIAILDSSTASNPLETGFHLDYLVITGNQRIKVKEILNSFQPEFIILDDNCSFTTSNRRAAECEELRIPYWNIRKQGAYKAKLSG